MVDYFFEMRPSGRREHEHRQVRGVPEYRPNLQLGHILAIVLRGKATVYRTGAARSPTASRIPDVPSVVARKCFAFSHAPAVPPGAAPMAIPIPVHSPGRLLKVAPNSGNSLCGRGHTGTLRAYHARSAARRCRSESGRPVKKKRAFSRKRSAGRCRYGGFKSGAGSSIIIGRACGRHGPVGVSKRPRLSCPMNVSMVLTDPYRWSLCGSRRGEGCVSGGAFRSGGAAGRIRRPESFFRFLHMKVGELLSPAETPAWRSDRRSTACMRST